MAVTKKLPDAEFEIMKVIWDNTPPISTNQIIAGLKDERQWKPQTVLTFLSRLIQRGFLDSEKIGKDRTYVPLVSEQDYLKFETSTFFKRYYENSLVGLINTLYAGKELSEKDILELKAWLNERT
jgi:predicted transcriptional regulator